jgi:hypothetical protein
MLLPVMIIDTKALQLDCVAAAPQPIRYVRHSFRTKNGPQINSADIVCRQFANISKTQFF